MDVITNSTDETQKWAEEFAKQFKNHGGVIALIGELGAGKTTFTQGFAKGLGIKEKVISPTFVLMRQHQIPKTNRWLFHLDLYRIENSKDLKALDLEELFAQTQNLILIEWAEKILGHLPPKTQVLHFSQVGPLQRKISFST